jgi:hypothetical protein
MGKINLDCHEDELEAIVSSFFYNKGKNKEFYMGMKEFQKIMAKDNPKIMEETFADIVSMVRSFFLAKGIYVDLYNKTILYMRAAKGMEVDYISNVFRNEDIAVSVCKFKSK